MPPKIEIKNVPPADVDRLVADLSGSGATDIQAVPEADGHLTLSFLPGDSDFPTDESQSDEDKSTQAPSLDGDPDFKTD